MKEKPAVMERDAPASTCVGEAKRTATDTGQGARGAPAAGAITREQLKTMTSAQIEAARKSGKLDHLLR